MTRGKVILLAAVTVIGGNFVAKRSGTFRRVWTS